MKTVADRIRHLSPCQEALAWAEGYTVASTAWAECQRGDWMLWLLGQLSGPPESRARKRLVLCACACARLALPYTQDGRVRACVETAERWARGEATMEEVREARTGAAEAAADADAAYDAAAYVAAYAAADAADARGAYAAAYAAADAAAARSKMLGECAAVVREHYPEPPEIISLNPDDYVEEEDTEE